MNTGLRFQSRVRGSWSASPSATSPNGRFIMGFGSSDQFPLQPFQRCGSPLTTPERITMRC